MNRPPKTNALPRPLAANGLLNTHYIRPFYQHLLIGTALGLLAWLATRIDSKVAGTITEGGMPGDLTRVLNLSEFFAHGFGLCVLCLGIWLMIPERRRQLPRLLSCAIFPSIAAHFIKLLIRRWRPIKYYDENSVAHFPVDQSETWLGFVSLDSLNVRYPTQSFPSAHTALTWGLAIGLSYMFPKGRWLFVGLAVLASLQRISSAAHWTSDVLAGAAIGFLIAGGLVQNWGIGYLCGRVEARQDVPVG